MPDLEPPTDRQLRLARSVLAGITDEQLRAVVAVVSHEALTETWKLLNALTVDHNQIAVRLSYDPLESAAEARWVAAVFTSFDTDRDADLEGAGASPQEAIENLERST